MSPVFIFKQCAFFAVLLSISLIGDFILCCKTVQNNIFLRCITDNFTHMCLGIISWLIVTSYEKLSFRLVIPCLLCGIFASLLDVDHFLMAKSLSLKDATNLQSRPPFHNTTLMVSAVSCFILFSLYKENEQLENIGWYILIATVSHHLRDALHRGLWLWPSSTKLMPFNYYLILSYLFPLAIGSLLKIIHQTGHREKVNALLV